MSDDEKRQSHTGGKVDIVKGGDLIPVDTSAFEAKTLPAPPEPSFWAKAWPWLRKWVLAPLPIILLVAVAIVLVVLGKKDLQIGGLLAKLTGKKKDGQKAVEVANTIPEDRVDKDGKIIPVGEPDEKGMTQAVVVPIESPGLFSDPDQVVINHPEEKKPVVVDLPIGVKASDVDKVIIVTPEVTAVTVKSTSKVSAKTVDDLLAKYGK